MYMETPAHPGGRAIVVRVLFFGPLAESLGEREVDIQLSADTKLADLISRLNLEEYPEIKRHSKLMSERSSFSA